MKVGWAIPLVAVVVVSCSVPPPPGSFDEHQRERLSAVARGARDAVVLIHPSPGHEEGSGTGFLFTSEGHILTAAHVVDEVTKAEVVLSDGSKYEARVVSLIQDNKPDVAVLRIESGQPLPHLNIGAAAKRGDTVLTIGHPAMASLWAPISGRVVDVTHAAIRVEVPSFLAISGAPVLNNEDGEVVGLVVGTTAPREKDPSPMPTKVVEDWQEPDSLKPPVTAVSANTLRSVVTELLGTAR